MINRYKYRRIIKNDLEQYNESFRNRNVAYINHYVSPKFNYLTDLSQYSFLTTKKHIWSHGDRFYKLAETYYGDAKDWWVIAKFNLKPTESHVKVGDVLIIPFPLDRVLEFMTG